MTDFARIILGLLFIFNVLALVIFTATRCLGETLPNSTLMVIAVNVFLDAVLFYALF